MTCQGVFTFIELSHVDGGSFINDRGQNIKYDESFKLKVQEKTDNGIKDRIFKIAKDSNLIPYLNDYKTYDEISLLFDVVIYVNNVKLVPIAVK